MWCRSIVILIILSMILPFIFVQADTILHKNFDEADEDIFAIISFISDTKNLCEQTLIDSYKSNCTIFFNDTKSITYSENFDKSSIIKADYLKEKIDYSFEIIEYLNKNPKTFEYLKEVLIPLKNLSKNVTNLVHNHHNLIHNFQLLINHTNTKISNLSNIFNVISKIQNNLSLLNLNIDEIETSIVELIDVLL